jgi:membrane protease YdiL (CAAX protease family)
MVALYHAGLKPLGVLKEPAGEVRQKVLGLGIDGVGKYVAMAMFYALAHSLLEEYYWRWFVFGQLRERMAVGWAILVSSVSFMAHHVLVLSLYFGWLSAATVLFSLAVAVGGAFWAWLYQRCGSLYPPWLSHALVDLAIFVVGFDMVRELFP